MCCSEGVELLHPFVYLWEDITQDTLDGLVDFIDSLLNTTFDFVLCICNTGFDCSQLTCARKDLQSIEHSAHYLPFEKIESLPAVDEVLRAMSACFARRQGSVLESTASSSHQNVPRCAMRTFMGK